MKHRYLGKSQKIGWIRAIPIFVSLVLCLVSCSPNALPGINAQIILPGHQLNPSQVEVKFNVLVPETSDAIILDILDEVTGIPYHPIRYRMENTGPNLYSISLPFQQNAIIKYRYLKRGSNDDVECDNLGQVINSRTYYAPAPGEINDTVYDWSDNPVSLPGGRITGQVVDQYSRQPLGSVLVSAAGRETMTDALGNFTLNHIPAGLQNVVVFCPDGSYLPDQQGAKVLVNQLTVANLSLQPARWVKVTFLVSPPPDMPPNDPPVRFMGNLLSLGDTFVGLLGGVSMDPLRAPVLVKQADGKLAVTLKLPAGYDLRYKYSLGDGFWNAEHTMDGQIFTRELTVPDQDSLINDQISAWGISGLSPIDFSVTVPDNTPADSRVSVQFSPFTWMEPIPMWPSGNNYWNITLFPPMWGLSQVNYQFCHDQVCGTSDKTEISAPDSGRGGVFTFSKAPQNLAFAIKNWIWWQNPDIPVTVSADKVTPRGNHFVAAVELSPSFSQNQISDDRLSFQYIHRLGANWVILTPQWTWDQQNQPFASKTPENAIYDTDLSGLSQSAAGNNLSVAYFPGILYPQPAKDWWENQAHDAAWWGDWFKTYQEFILDQSILAEKNHAGMLVMGGPAVVPALPGGVLKNGSSSGVFPYSLLIWQNLIKNIRDHYHGILVWAFTDEDAAAIPDELIHQMDGLYLLYSGNMRNDNQRVNADRLAIALNRFQKFNKPVLIGIEYPSRPEATGGCILAYDSSCWVSNNEDTVDLNQQLAIYESIFGWVNQNPNKITGIVSRGFTPSGPRLDPSSSIYGKPAADLIWYWYPRWTSSPTE